MINTGAKTNYVPTPMSTPKDADYIIASYDAPTRIKNSADYVCDLGNDQVQINEAISKLGSYGGKILLSEGRFLCGASINPSSKVTIEGMGFGTILRAGAAVNIISGTNLDSVHIKNLAIDGYKSGFADQNDTTIQNGIYMNEWYNSIIENVLIQSCSESGILMRTQTEASAKLLHNQFIGVISKLNNKHGFYGKVYAEYCNIIGSSFSNNVGNGILLEGANNSFGNCKVIQNSLNGLLLNTSTKPTNNSFSACDFNHNTQNGVYLNAVGNNIFGTSFIGCKSIANGYNGFLLYNPIYTVIQGSIITTNSYGNNNLYDNIQLDGNAGFNIISSNPMITQSSAQTRYGINEKTGCNYNKFIANNLISHTTGAKVISGANSIDQFN